MARRPWSTRLHAACQSHSLLVAHLAESASDSVPEDTCLSLPSQCWAPHTLAPLLCPGLRPLGLILANAEGPATAVLGKYEPRLDPDTKPPGFEYQLGFPGGSDVKNSPAMQETRVQSLGWDNPLEKGMATHSSIFAWKISWTKEPGGLQSMVLQS